MIKKSYSFKELADIANDPKDVTRIFEEFEIPENGTAHFSFGQRQLMSVFLSLGAIKLRSNKLQEDLLRMLIKRTAVAVDIFLFLNLVAASAKIEITPNDYDVIPGKLRVALLKNSYCPKVEEMIGELDPGGFRSVIAYIAAGDEVEELDYEFTLPIVRYIYKHKIVSSDLILSLMATSLRKDTIKERTSDEDVFDELFGIIFGV